MKFLLPIFCLMVGCYYSPDYKTRQGVDVFCNCDYDCPDQAYVEHALDFLLTEVPGFYEGWTRDIRGDRIYWKPGVISCTQSDTGCALAVAHSLGIDVLIPYEPDQLVSQTALFREFMKPYFTGGFSSIDYQSEEWLLLDLVYDLYRIEESIYLDSL